jgi:putative transposase
MITYDYAIGLIELGVPADHIHMIVRTEPKISPSSVMQVIKSISPREFLRLHPEIRTKYFWGGKLGTQSYFVETIGNTSEEVIRKYAQDQLKAMDKSEKYYAARVALKLGRLWPTFLSEAYKDLSII